MIEFHLSRTILSVLWCALIIDSALTDFSAPRLVRSEPVLIVKPTSVVIKVGDSAKINLTLTNLALNTSNICFSVDGFPTSGFVTSIVPECVSSQLGQTISILRVEATPAAAPQRFTVFVVASGENWTARVPIAITVEPAMPAWIPWSIILVFILILIIPLIIKTKKTRHRTRK